MPEKETAKGTSGWTVEILYVHFSALLAEAEKHNNQRFIDQEKAVKAALAAAETAVNKAEYNGEKWRDSANEWRQAMDDREIKFMPRPEYQSAHQSLVERMGTMENRITKNEGTGAGLKQGWGILLAAVMFIVGVITIYAFIKH